MIVSDRHKTAPVHSRLSLASAYLLLALMTSACLPHIGSGYIGFAATVVDSGLMSGGLEDDLDARSPVPVVSALPLFAAPIPRQDTGTRRQRHSFSILLIRAPPGSFS